MMFDRLADTIYTLLGGEWCGNTCVPCDYLKCAWKDNGAERIAVVLNDGFELGMGTPEEWYIMVRRDNAHRLAWFILWHWWIAGEWFGLRRTLWYWALNKRVSRYRRYGVKA